jgi:hypothetical protein
VSRARTVATALLAVSVLLGCGTDRPDVAPIDTPEEGPVDDEEERTDADLVGVLGGDAQLEGGCAWITVEDGRVEPAWPDGYRVEFGPLRLVDGQGATVAEEGDRLHLNGSLDPDVMTICQIGPVFVVEDIAHVESG